MHLSVGDANSDETSQPQRLMVFFAISQHWIREPKPRALAVAVALAIIKVAEMQSIALNNTASTTPVLVPA